MKTREQLREEIRNKDRTSKLDVILEVLVDIRELLENPPIEITGSPMSDKEYRDLFNPPTP